MKVPALVIVCAALAAGAASGQSGLAKRGGRDTIGNGRPVDCLIDTSPRARCTFYPRNANGSFALESRARGGHLFYATRIGTDSMRFEDWDGGSTTINLGIFTRSRDDRACWVRRDHRICAW